MSAGALEGRRILIVEDDYLVGETLSEFLSSAGATVTGVIGWVEEAVAFASNPLHAFDTAILDLNLHGTYSYPVADILIARDIGFVFATGYGPGTVSPPYDRYPRCTKPFSRAALIDALQLAMPAGR